MFYIYRYYVLINKTYLKLILFLIIIKLILFSGAFLGYKIIPFDDEMYDSNFNFFEKGDGFFEIWQTWDSQWYLKIARDGYFTGSFTEMSDIAVYAFFPLFPLLIYFLNFLFSNLVISGLFVSFICSVVTVIYLYKLINLDYPHLIARNSIIYYLLFPTAFFFSAIYTESLFLMLVVLTFYYAREQKWWLCSFFGVLCSLTRTIGVLLLFPILIEYFKSLGSNNFKIRFNKNIVWLLIMPLGLGIYQLFIWLTTNNFSTYFISQKFWGRQMFNFGAYITHLTNLTFHSFKYSFLDLVTVIIFIFMLYHIYKRLRFSYFLYSVLIMILPLLSANLMSMTRLVLISFPHYILLALWTSDYKSGKVGIWFYILSILFGVLQVFLAALFVNNYWIA